MVMGGQFTEWMECILLPPRRLRLPSRRRLMINSIISVAPSGFSLTRGGISRTSHAVLFASCSRFTRLETSTNGQVERYKRTLMDAVRCHVDKAQNCWSIAIGHEPELRLHVQQAYAGARGQYSYTKINLHVQHYVLEIKIHVHFKNTTI